jgi:ABC-type sugar transport system ATPase subunit
MEENSTILSLRHISKSYPGVKAVNDINIEFKKGEVHVLVGENGAGKSTLIKIIYRRYPGDEGEIQIGGNLIPLFAS